MQDAFQSLTYAEACQDCGARTECRGVQALTAGRLRWDVESLCPGCGAEFAACDGEIPPERREQMLAVHGPRALRTTEETADRIAIMRVLRGEFGLHVSEAKEAARMVLNGQYTGTLPEMELLAGRLRERGVGVTVVSTECTECTSNSTRSDKPAPPAPADARPPWAEAPAW